MNIGSNTTFSNMCVVFVLQTPVLGDSAPIEPEGECENTECVCNKGS